MMNMEVSREEVMDEIKVSAPGDNAARMRCIRDVCE